MLKDLDNLLNYEEFLKRIYKIEQDNIDRLSKLKVSNIEALEKIYEDSLTAEFEQRAAAERDWLRKSLAAGMEKEKAIRVAQKITADAEWTEKQKQIQNNIKLSKKEREEARKNFRKEYEEKLKAEEDLDEETRKLILNRLDEIAAEEEKQRNKKLSNMVKDNKSMKELQEAGFSAEEIKDARSENLKNTIGSNVGKAVLDFAKQLSGTIKEIAYSKTEIDTRLYGSNNSKLMGSYWNRISTNIAENVAASPFVKQADVVTNLKTLVSKGISFNVEQRAFLDTISEKIATTFEATDNTLLKLVRIQQADTTAARLGMEAALNEFLNSMYETTEYMTEAAASIRANIYEASALMGATEATAFEYQVQKWMGSLHSVGFNNTGGLSGALGKLAAGDISAVTDGGYGNLLVMAANKANLSIAEILADGLDDSKTNQLMQAMVEYLGQIYAETKNSKVVAQQFASVYGLTASDLKAAANLYGSTTNISKSVLNYSGMLGNLNRMADSMWSRTSMGEMLENLWGNFQYGLAGGIANNPILYATYQAASMLDSVAGGIALPDIKVMGSGVNLQTTVADLMRVGAIGASALSGIGKLIAGIAKGSGGGFSGSGMLKAFGVDNNITTLSRGKGTGIEALNSGSDVSTSGFVGNTDGSDVQNKTLDDANEDGNKQLAEKQEEDNETKLSTVDEHIIQIYQLLQDVTSGISSFRVIVDTTLPNGFNA